MIFNKMIKKYNPGIPINLNSLNDYSYKIKIKKINNYNLYYYNEKWQTPVITEKNVFDIYFKNKDLPTNYFAFPWATLIDQYNFNKNTYLIDIVNKYKINDEICFTICQHICFKRIIPILEKIGITHLFTPHKSKLDYKFIKTNIVIIPFILYPVNQNDKLEDSSDTSPASKQPPNQESTLADAKHNKDLNNAIKEIADLAFKQGGPDKSLQKDE